MFLKCKNHLQTKYVKNLTSCLTSIIPFSVTVLISITGIFSDSMRAKQARFSGLSSSSFNISALFNTTNRGYKKDTKYKKIPANSVHL